MKNRISYQKLLLLILSSTVLLFCLLVIGISNIWIDLFGLITYILSMYSIFLLTTDQMIKYLSMILGSSWAVLAVFLLENTSVVVAGTSSAHTGSFITYVFGWLVFYLVIMIMENKKLKKERLKPLPNVNVVNYKIINTIRLIVIVGSLIELVIFVCIINKPYFIYGTDRTSYESYGIIAFLLNHIGFFTLIIPLTVLIIKKDTLLSATYIALYMLINLWIGEKFTGLFICIYFFVLSYIAVYGWNIKNSNIKKILYGVAAFIVLAFVVIYFQMKVVGGRNFLTYISERISAQGYLWWLTYSNDAGNGMHLNELVDELEPFYKKLSGSMLDYDFGIYKLMKLYYIPSRWMNMLSEGFRGTESSRATFYYYAKMPGLIIGQLILGFLTFGITNLCFKYLRQLDYLRVIFSFYILRNFIAIYSMSDFYLLVKPAMILSYLVLLFGGKIKIIVSFRIPKLKLIRLSNKGP